MKDITWEPKPSSSTWEAHVKTLPTEVKRELANHAAQMFLDGVAKGKSDAETQLREGLMRLIQENEEESHTFEDCRDIHIGRAEAFSDAMSLFEASK